MKSAWLQIRADPKDINKLKKLAKSRHMTVSAYVWFCIWEQMAWGNFGK